MNEDAPRGYWFECIDCKFATNSMKNADQHESETLHIVQMTDDGI